MIKETTRAKDALEKAMQIILRGWEKHSVLFEDEFDGTASERVMDKEGYGKMYKEVEKVLEKYLGQ